MKLAPTLFHTTALLVVIQAIIGGLVVLGYAETSIHIELGYLVFLLALATLAGAGLSRPRHKPALAIACLLVLLILVQGALGFAWLGSKNDVILAVHFTNALAIYGLSIAGAFTTLSWSRMAAPSSRLSETDTS